VSAFAIKMTPCCSVSVLDRLNALLEPNGSLSLSERGVIAGAVPTVMPHPDFRYDPVAGVLQFYDCHCGGCSIFVDKFLFSLIFCSCSAEEWCDENQCMCSIFYFMTFVANFYFCLILIGKNCEDLYSRYCTVACRSIVLISLSIKLQFLS